MNLRWELGIGCFGLLFSVFVVLYWVPNDIQGAFVETTRRGKLEAGDAFFPLLLGVLIGVISLIQIAYSIAGRKDNRDTHYPTLTIENLQFLALFGGILAISLNVLYWVGPIAVGLFETDATYRQLRDTVPYKYAGFCVGGFLLTFTLIMWAEGKPSWRAAIVSLALITLLIVIFDVGLDNVLLPPNADF